jgi:hypothetical protein
MFVTASRTTGTRTAAASGDGSALTHMRTSDARRRQDVAGGRELCVKRQVPGLAGHQAHVGPGGGADPRELGDLLACPGVVAADELADQVSLHRDRDRGQAEAEEIMGVPRYAQPLASHRLAGEFAAQVLQLHGPAAPSRVSP